MSSRPDFDRGAMGRNGRRSRLDLDRPLTLRLGGFCAVTWTHNKAFEQTPTIPPGTGAEAALYCGRVGGGGAAQLYVMCPVANWPACQTRRAHSDLGDHQNHKGHRRGGLKGLTADCAASGLSPLVPPRTTIDCRCRREGETYTSFTRARRWIVRWIAARGESLIDRMSSLLRGGPGLCFRALGCPGLAPT